MITPEQCRAARALLDWTQKDLADRAKISNQTVRNFEHRKSALKESTAQLLRMIFEAEGVVLLDPNGGGPGACLADPVEE